MSDDNIPRGIWYSAEHDNFYSQVANIGLGNDFFKQYRDRKHLFPQRRDPEPEMSDADRLLVLALFWLDNIVKECDLDPATTQAVISVKPAGRELLTTTLASTMDKIRAYNKDKSHGG